MVGSREKLASAKPQTCTFAVTHRVTSVARMSRHEPPLAALLVTLAVLNGCSTGPVV